MNRCLKKSKTNFFSPNGTFTEYYPYKRFATKALRRKTFKKILTNLTPSLFL